MASFLAVAVALASQAISNHRVKREQRIHDKDAALQVAWKLLAILNAGHDIYRHFWVAPDPNLKGLPGQVERWRSTFPLIGVALNPSLALSEGQTNLLLANGASDLAREAYLGFSRYHSLVLSVLEYKTRYEDLQKLMPPPTSFFGTTAAHGLTNEQALTLMPYVIQLESLIEGIRQNSMSIVSEMATAIDSFKSHSTRIYGKPIVRTENDPELGDLGNLGHEIPRR